MSTLVVEVCRVEAVENHPNADRLCVVKIKGWEVCSARNPDTNTNEYAAGDLAVYFPPDSVLPPALAEEYGVVKYASPVKNEDGSLKGHRIRVARLRTFPSYGFIAKPKDPAWEIGRDVAAELGVTNGSRRSNAPTGTPNATTRRSTNTSPSNTGGTSPRS